MWVRAVMGKNQRSGEGGKNGDFPGPVPRAPYSLPIALLSQPATPSPSVSFALPPSSALSRPLPPSPPPLLSFAFPPPALCSHLSPSNFLPTLSPLFPYSFPSCTRHNFLFQSHPSFKKRARTMRAVANSIAEPANHQTP